MGDTENEILKADTAVETKVSADDVTIEDLTAQAAKTAANKKKPTKNGGFWSSLKGEFKKIIWPSGRTLAKETIAVIVVSLLLGAIIAVVDLLIRMGLEQIITQ